MTPERAATFVLNPAVRVLWRSRDSVSLELGADAVVLDGVDSDYVHGLLHRASASRLPPELLDSAFLWRREHGDPDAASTGPADDVRYPPPAPRLAGELVSLAARCGERAAELLSARSYCAVWVSGTGRAGPLVAAALAAAGVGRVRCTEHGVVRLHHALPGGLSPLDEGRPLAAATESVIRRAGPDVDTSVSPGERPDLVVLAVDEPVDEERRRGLHADGIPHLQVSVGPGSGRVGPLVVPGLTSCLHCADLHRRDRDPQWPMLAVQLTTPRRHGPASDVGVAMSMAAAATIQALAFLDGEEPAIVEGSLELFLPDWRLRRRDRPRHADCDCGSLGTMTE